jgi:photosystem II stability/assembly factor-like uncharacterized protein
MALTAAVQVIKQAISNNFEVLGSVALVFFTFSSPARAQTWTQTSAPPNAGAGLTCSADGRIMAAGSVAGIYISTNYGITWVSNGISGFSNCKALAASADGARLAAAADGAIFVSTNLGASWQSNTISADGYNPLACSADGSNLALISYPGTAIYFSTNSGSTWFPNSPPVSDLRSVSLSADGKTVVAANASTIILSTNLGQNWSTQGALPTNAGAPIRILAASSDCVRLAVANFVSIYTSTNAGITWWSNGFPVIPQWLSVAVSADGARIAAANLPGQIYTSTNSGLNWSSNNAPSKSWLSIASSADGRRLLAVPNGGGIWTSYSPGASLLQIVPANNYVKISWLVPSSDFVLEEKSDLLSTNWTAVSEVPNINTSNLHYEASVSMSGSNAFYRLRMR